AQAAHRWVQRELAKLIHAPYFLVTFTLPSQLRSHFFGPRQKQAYELFFQAVSGALSEKLAVDKALRAQTNGFVALLHTWTQKLEFHPHIHCLVPGAGLNLKGQFVRVRKPQFLLHLPHLQAAFRQHLYRLLKQNDWPVARQVWRKDWGVHIQPSGSGLSALKYLGAYVSRTALTNARMLRITQDSVSFRWKDRSDRNRRRELTLSGVEFVRRYLRHVLPTGLRSVRYYGFCHPAAKASRMRVQFHSGRVLNFAPVEPLPGPTPNSLTALCPICGQVMQLLVSVSLWHKSRGPPSQQPSVISCAA